MEAKYCLICGKELTIEQLHRGNWKYCSRKCASAARKEKKCTCTCIVCGKEFQAATERARLCSPACKRERKRIQYLESGKMHTSARKPKTKQKHESKISEEQAAAQAHGMSYGKWKALQYIENMPKINTKV